MRAINPIWKSTSKTTILDSMRDHLFEIARLDASCVVLDMACGRGTCALGFAPNVAKVIAVDISEEQLASCRDAAGKAGLTNVEVIHHDAQQSLGLEDGSIDIVTGVGAFSNIDDPSLALLEAQRLLKPDGQLLIGDFLVPAEAQEVWGVLSSLRYGSRRPYLDYHQYMDLLYSTGFQPEVYRPIRWRYCFSEESTSLPDGLGHAFFQGARDTSAHTKNLLRMEYDADRLIVQYDCFAMLATKRAGELLWSVDDTRTGPNASEPHE